MNEVRLIDANALKANLPEPTSITQKLVYRTLCDFIDNAPTVTNGTYEQGFRVGAYGRLDEIRPHGEWIFLDRNDRFKIGNYKCNLCGYKYPVADELSKNFCPNCGAKMGGEKNG